MSDSSWYKWEAFEKHSNKCSEPPHRTCWNLGIISKWSFKKLDICENKIQRILEKALGHVSGVIELNLEDNELFEIPKIAVGVFLEPEMLQIVGTRMSLP